MLKYPAMCRSGRFFLILGLLLVSALTAIPAAASSLTPAQATPAGLLPTPTALPANPASVDMLQLTLSGVQGIIFVAVLFALFGLYLALRNLNRER